METGNASIRGGWEVAGLRNMDIREMIGLAKAPRKRPKELRKTRGIVHKTFKSPITVSWICCETFAGRKSSKTEATEPLLETLGIESM